MPAGVVYTTFHHPVTGANVVTTENSDWATNCPEYKVTAVQVGVANAARRRRRRRDPRAGGDARVSTRAQSPPRRGWATTSPASSRTCPPAEAAEAIARHIETFWDPRMRRALEALAAAHDDALDPVLVDAAGRLAFEDTHPEPDVLP